MSFDRDGLIAACQAHRRVVRVVVAEVRGSAPREVGAAMLVWPDGFSGTVGGGTLEYEALHTARALKTPGTCKFTRHALGPDLGQCCGGSVDLLFEVYDAQTAGDLPRDVIARGTGDMPLAVARLLNASEASRRVLHTQRIGTWLVEPVGASGISLWIWGAGHVGRALVSVLEALPQFQITWADTDTARFPASDPGRAEIIAAQDLTRLIRFAPQDAMHLIVTYSHDIDLALCHHLLLHGFGFAGLIGSATKWARFRSRLAKLGHPAHDIQRITCPMGNPQLGKHPQAIAVGVAADLLSLHDMQVRQKEYG